jgi:hypothetical protein
MCLHIVPYDVSLQLNKKPSFFSFVISIRNEKILLDIKKKKKNKENQHKSTHQQATIPTEKKEKKLKKEFNKKNSLYIYE